MATALAASQMASEINAADRLIVALDFDDPRLARQLVDTLGATVSCYKVGYYLQLVSGYDVLVDDLVAMGKRVLLDTKVCDIEDVVMAAVSGAVKRRASFLTIHGNGDVTDSALQAAVRAKAYSDLKLLLVTVLTSMDDLDLHAVGYGRSATEEAKARALRAIRFGFDGVICSGREAADIRQLTDNPDFIIATPGIRPRGLPRGDQKRVSTPAEAIVSGADYLIIGRPIIQASDPMFATLRIIDEMQAAFDTRYLCQ
jgi:orotidine-5'-phosphate decarboxylase